MPLTLKSLEKEMEKRHASQDQKIAELEEHVDWLLTGRTTDRRESREARMLSGRILCALLDEVLKSTVLENRSRWKEIRAAAENLRR